MCRAERVLFPSIAVILAAVGARRLLLDGYSIVATIVITGLVAAAFVTAVYASVIFLEHIGRSAE